VGIRKVRLIMRAMLIITGQKETERIKNKLSDFLLMSLQSSWTTYQQENIEK